VGKLFLELIQPRAARAFARLANDAALASGDCVRRRPAVVAFPRVFFGSDSPLGSFFRSFASGATRDFGIAGIELRSRALSPMLSCQPENFGQFDQLGASQRFDAVEDTGTAGDRAGQS